MHSKCGGWSSRLIGLVLLVFWTTAADAELAYRYRSTFESDLQRFETAGQGWIDGDHRRVELDPNPSNPRSFDLSISSDAGATWIQINLQNQTYYRSDEERLTPAGGWRTPDTSRLFHLPVRTDESVDRIKVETFPPAEGGEIAGRETTRHELRFSYRIRGRLQGSRLEALVSSSVMVWKAEDLPVLRSDEGVATGIAEVDRQIEQWESAHPGAVLRKEVSITRTFKGATPSHERSIFVVEEIEERPADPALFVLPAELTHQLPVIAGPGGGPASSTAETPSHGSANRVLPPRLIHRVNPEYPAALRRSRIEGKVEIEALIGTDGVPREVRVVRSDHSTLSPLALNAVKQWRFSPGTLDGEPVDVIFNTTVNFNLPR
jgi:TonB family protein